MTNDTPSRSDSQPVKNPLAGAVTPNIGGMGSTPPGVPPRDQYRLKRHWFGRLLLYTIALAMVGGFGYFAYIVSVDVSDEEPPPIIADDDVPFKIPPDEAGIKEPPPPELNVYDMLEGKDVDTENASKTEQNDSQVESKITTDSNASEPQSPSIERNLESLLNNKQKDFLSSVVPGESSVVVRGVESDILLVKDKYMVQLASLQSRVQARAGFKTLQKRHVELLGTREPFISRADLGAKGVYYRVNVPGFLSLSAARTFCDALKERNQDCLVVKQRQ